MNALPLRLCEEYNRLTPASSIETE